MSAVAAPIALSPQERDALARVLARGFADSVDGLAESSERRWWRVMATEEFDAWLIDWPVATSVHPHDHGGSAASISVLRGRLTELLLDDGAQRVTTLRRGTVHRVSSGSVHDIANPGPARATSIHVYSPPLRTMAFYDRDGTRLRQEEVAVEPVLWDAVLPSSVERA